MTSLSIKDFDAAMNLDATNKGAVSKLVKAWEAKNDQRVKRAAGLGLMAVSLAACGGADDSDDGDDGTDPTPVSMSVALTIGQDIVEAGVDTGEGDDIITGALVQNNAGALANSLDVTDEIDGGDGSDILSVTVNAFNGAPIVSNVETVMVRGVTAASTIDMANFDDSVETIVIRDTAVNMTFNNIQSAAAIEIANVAADLVIDFDDDVLGGATTGLISVDNFVGDLTVSVGGDDVLTGIVIDVASDSEITATGTAAVATVLISGTGDLELAEVAAGQFASITTVNASGLAGGLTMVLTNAAAAVTFTGGSGDDVVTASGANDAISTGAGDDTITMAAGDLTIDAGADDDVVVAAGTLTAADVVVGGAGTDTFSVAARVTLVNGAGVSGFEILALTTGGAQDLANLAGNSFETVVLAAVGNAITNAGANTNVAITALTAASSFALTDATGTTDDVTVTMSSAAAITQAAALTIAGVETIAVVSIDTDATAHTNTLVLTAAAATTVTVSGGTGLVLTATGSTAITTMDASGVVLGAATATGVTYTSLNVTVGEVVTITGSNGIDLLTGTANANDTISGGAGADTIVYTGGTDTFTGGAGNDVFDINAVGATAGSLTITDIAAGDTIDIAGITTGTLANMTAAAWDAAQVVLGAGATLDQYLDAAADQDGSAHAVAEWFVHDGNTYIVISNDNGTTGASAGFTDGVDAAIMLTGTFDIDGSSFATEILTIAS